MIKKNSTYLGDTAGTLIKNTHDILDKPSAQFLPGTPLKCIYFNIDRKRSIYSYGSKTVNNYYGGSIKYKQINDFVIHHITDTITNAGDSRNESFDYIFNEDPFEAYLIPGTYVRPNVGDRIAFEFDDYQTMFMVTESAPESTIVSRPVFRIKIVRDNQTQARTDQRGKPYDIRYSDYRDWETDRKSTRLNSSHSAKSRMPSSA